jgi:hypothetical protein
MSCKPFTDVTGQEIRDLANRAVSITDSPRFARGPHWYAIRYHMHSVSAIVGGYDGTSHAENALNYTKKVAEIAGNAARVKELTAKRAALLGEAADLQDEITELETA